jgi:protein TonB
MFETSVVRAQAQAAQGRYRLLTASIVAHSAVIVGAVVVSIASVEFPAAAPKEYARVEYLTPVRIPPPLGNPNGGARPQVQQPAAPRPATPAQITAPSTVPETVTPAAAPSTGTGDASANTGTESGPIGVPWGEPNSIGDLDAPPAPIDVPQQPEEKIYEAYEVQAPVLISRVEPRYPAVLMKAAPTATVVLRCVIDKNGFVRDPQIIVGAMSPFNAEVLNVLPRWRYKPATYGGKAVDSYLNLTVHFAIRR